MLQFQSLMKSHRTGVNCVGSSCRRGNILSFFTILLLVGCLQVQLSGIMQPGKLYLVVQGGKFGFINGKGQVIVKPQFLRVMPFSEGLAPVMAGTPRAPQYAFIDTTGRVVIRTQDAPSEKGFSSGVARMLKNSSSSSYYIDKAGNKVGVYYAGAEDCTEGLCAVRMGSMGPKQWGYVDTAGAMVVKGQYDWAMPFSEGLGRVGVTMGEAREEKGVWVVDGKVGFIDRSGKAVTPLEYDKAQDFSNGMAGVMVGGRWGFINQSGEMVVAPRFEEVQPFEGGLARVKIDGRWGYIDKGGMTVIAAKYEAASNFREGWAAVKVDGRAFFIDRDGRDALQTPYSQVGTLRNGLCLFVESGKVGLMDKQGRVLVKARYDSLEMVSDELVRVGNGDGAIGYIDYGGRVVWGLTY